jgi:ACT domain-containing protein
MDKIKNKIKSLLNLSMSENKHEADLAMKRALELMNRNNLTRDEINQQEFVCKRIELKYKRTPAHILILHDRIGKLSGCLFTFGGHKGENQRGLITGRERDVENAIYLISFLEREVENKSKEYASNLNKRLKTINKKKRIKSFKTGFIYSVVERLESDKSAFFNTDCSGAIVPVDTRADEAREYFELNIGALFGHIAKTKLDHSAKADGAVVGQKINLNVAVSGQSDVLAIGR